MVAQFFSSKPDGARGRVQLKFHLIGTEEYQEEIERYGGRIVTRMKDANYVIVPLGPTLSISVIDDIIAQCYAQVIANYRWVAECIARQTLVDVAQYEISMVALRKEALRRHTIKTEAEGGWGEILRFGFSQESHADDDSASRGRSSSHGSRLEHGFRMDTPPQVDQSPSPQPNARSNRTETRVVRHRNPRLTEHEQESMARYLALHSPYMINTSGRTWEGFQNMAGNSHRTAQAWGQRYYHNRDNLEQRAEEIRHIMLEDRQRRKNAPATAQRCSVVLKRSVSHRTIIPSHSGSVVPETSNDEWQYRNDSDSDYVPPTGNEVEAGIDEDSDAA